MFERSRHFAPASAAWDEAHARAAIRDIAEDARSALDSATLWPAHPLDDRVPDGIGCLYFGAAGVVWALDHLRRAGAVAEGRDWAPTLRLALARNAAWLATSPYPDHASLLMGELGILLVEMRVAPGPAVADAIHALAAANSGLPVLELMWGLPGSMLACVHMDAMTGDPRFEELFRAQADRLLGELETTQHGPVWIQDLYGQRQRYLGAVHGFAGNMLALVHGWDWLTADQQAVVADAVPRTLAATALRSASGANWPAVVPSDRAPVLCQHCHGAPGMVTALADAPFSTPALETLLREGGELTWNAGALTKGANLCHGTSGNGYVLLKLHRRTRDPVWLERARAFAMTSITQVREARAALGRGRYSLWTGDLGVAVYLWHCITGQPSFPTVDVF